MGSLAPELPLIGRDDERARLLANVARGRHTLLVGPIGAGKTHLLRAVAARRCRRPSTSRTSSRSG